MRTHLSSIKARLKRLAEVQSRFQIKPLEIQENIDLNERQSPVNWELVNIKYLVFLVLLLHYIHAHHSGQCFFFFFFNLHFLNEEVK